MGALSRLRDFTQKQVKRLLIVDTDDIKRKKVVELVAGDDVKIDTASTAESALDLVNRETFDCMIINMSSSSEAGKRLLATLASSGHERIAPALLYVPDSVDGFAYRDIAPDLVVKLASLPSELVDYTAQFLHRNVASLPEDRRLLLNQMRQKEPSLEGRKVLIVDDDIRNIFSLTSVLEQYKIDVVHADNGRDGIELLRTLPDIDVGLIDIMMPEMDGFQTMREIRKHDHLKGVPLIAVTAKAMKGDRQKCIEAGASDYIAKPVDLDLLLSLLRVWIARERHQNQPAGGVLPQAQMPIQIGN
jgi:CheY-like chemotaxis protein